MHLLLVASALAATVDADDLVGVPDDRITKDRATLNRAIARIRGKACPEVEQADLRFAVADYATAPIATIKSDVRIHAVGFDTQTVGLDLDCAMVLAHAACKTWKSKATMYIDTAINEGALLVGFACEDAYPFPYSVALISGDGSRTDLPVTGARDEFFTVGVPPESFERLRFALTPPENWQPAPSAAGDSLGSFVVGTTQGVIFGSNARDVSVAFEARGEEIHRLEGENTTLSVDGRYLEFMRVDQALFAPGVPAEPNPGALADAYVAWEADYVETNLQASQDLVGELAVWRKEYVTTEGLTVYLWGFNAPQVPGRTSAVFARPGEGCVFVLSTVDTAGTPAGAGESAITTVAESARFSTAPFDLSTIAAQ